MRILLVEDNPDIAANLAAFFQPLGHVLQVARTGPEGLARARDSGLDVLVLDLGLPGLDGVELCRLLRADQRVALPVLMLTARDSLQDKVQGYEAGADDYLVKPFSMVELELRLKALVRRSTGTAGPALVRYCSVSLDLRSLQALRGGMPLRLTPTGYKLLAALLRAAPNLVRREALEAEVWGAAPPPSDALRTHIHALRLALDRPFDRPLLQTVPGLGYRLVDGDV